MIKYHLHGNGWTVILDDFKFKTATQLEINEIAKLIANNTLVVCKNQEDLTVDDELRIANMFGDPGVLNDPQNPIFSKKVVDKDGIIVRVSGAIDDNNDPIGIAGYESEMSWHSTAPSFDIRKSIDWLRGVSGSKGSRTSFINNIISYQDLDQNLKNFLLDKKIFLKEKKVGFSLENPNEEILLFLSDETDEEHVWNVVHTNIAGKTGLYFPWVFINRFQGMSAEESKDIILSIVKFITQEKYIYHHDWEDGDVVIADQWLGLHKRCKFKNIKHRVLHRMEFEFPEQDYK